MQRKPANQTRHLLAACRNQFAEVRELDLEDAALALAQKRRFGPFGSAELDRPVREKQIAAMLRAAGFEPVWKDWDPSYDRPEAQLA